MGLKETILDTAEDIGRDLAVNGIAVLASWIAKKVMGDAADDTARERILRAALAAATEAAQNEAFLRAGGAAVLESQMLDIQRRSLAVLEAFKPPTSPTVPALGLDIEYITAEEAARRASILEIQADLDAKADLEVLTAKQAAAALAKLAEQDADQDGEG